MMLQPSRIARATNGGPPLPPSSIVRALGVRLVVQGGAEMVSRDRPLILAGAVVDVVHAASMVAAGRVWLRYRRAAAVSAVTASVSAAAAVAIELARR